MLDFLWTIWLGAWTLFKMLAPPFIFAVLLTILDFYVPGSYPVIISILFVLTILFWIGTECKDAKREQQNIRYHGKS